MPSPFSAAPVDEDETVIKLSGRAWRFWDDVEIIRSIDAYTVATFTSPFEADRREFREAFRPFTYLPAEISIGGELIDTGVRWDVSPSTDENSRRVAVSCYSKPGVLHRSDSPISLLPFEARGLTIKQIAQRVCEPFGIGVEVEGDPGPPFKRVKQQLDGKVQSYLVELAQQRAFVLSSTPTGNVLLHKSKPIGRPVARLAEGTPPVLAVTPTFNADEYYSEITGIVGRKVTRRGSKYTAQNPRLHTSLRCQTFMIEDAEKADAPAAVRARMGRMFANAFSVSVELPTWRDPQGRLWKPNTTVKLTAPNAMVFSEYEFLIRQVSLRRNTKSRTATLSLVMPGVFNSEIPPKFPWD